MRTSCDRERASSATRSRCIKYQQIWNRINGSRPNANEEEVGKKKAGNRLPSNVTTTTEECSAARAARKAAPYGAMRGVVFGQSMKTESQLHAVTNPGAETENQPTNAIAAAVVVRLDGEAEIVMRVRSRT